MAKLCAAVSITVAWVTGCAQMPPSHSVEVIPAVTLERAVQAALADASRRTGLAIEALQLHSAAAVIWPDGSLGCPQGGRVYTQALIPGYRVRIRTSEQEFEYHAALRGAVVLCPASRVVEPLPDDGRR